MADIFLEHMVKRKKGGKELGISAAAVAAALIVVGALFPWLMALPLVFAVQAAAVYGAYVVITMQNVEYEYSFTNGELDVDKIVAKRKRKRVATVDASRLEMIAPVDDERFLKEQNGNFAKTIDAGDGTAGYFVIFSEGSQRVKMIFNPPENMLEAFRRIAPSKSKF